jgi:DNA-binding transcriptional regulator YhcF (GntR family)
MSYKAEDWAWSQELPGNIKLVLLALARRYNGKTKRCDPTIRMLVADTGLSAPTVCKGLDILEDEGLIATKRGHGYTHNQYTLYIEAVSKVKQVEFDSAIKCKDIAFENEIKLKNDQNQIQKDTESNSNPEADVPYIAKKERTGKEKGIGGAHTPKKLIVSEAFIQRMIAEFPDLGPPEDIRLEIAFALGHKSARDWRGPPELGVKRWLLRNRKWNKANKNGIKPEPVQDVSKFYEGHYGEILKQRLARPP